MSFKKGQPAWNKGKKFFPLSKEIRQKMSNGQLKAWQDKRKRGKNFPYCSVCFIKLGDYRSIVCKKHKKLSEEHKLRISMGNKGKIRTKEMKKHYSKSKLGKPNLAVKGAKHPNWKGGIKPITQQIRHCFQYRQWRSDVFTRDNFTCVLCGIKSGNGKAVYLEADHYPKMFSTIFHENKIKSSDEALTCEEFWNINNGRTLCEKCHNLTKGVNQWTIKS